jgi:hypothetical protein
MFTYGQLLKRHGLKLWLANLLGYLATSFASGILIMVLIFVGLIGFGASIGEDIFRLFNENLSPDQQAHLISSIFSSPGLWITLLIVLILGILISLVTSAFLEAGSLSMAVEAAEADKSEISTFFERGFKLTFKMFGVLILTGLPQLIPVTLFLTGIILMIPDGLMEGAPEAAGSASANIVSLLFGLLLLLIGFLLSILFYLMFLHAPVILAAERNRVTDAVKQSVTLFRKAFGKVLITALLCFAIGSAVTLPMILILVPLIIAGGESDSINILSNLIQFLWQFVSYPVIAALTSLLIAYRYFKYLRSIVRPDLTSPGTRPENEDPGFSLKSDISPQPPSGPKGSFPWEERFDDPDRTDSGSDGTERKEN